jgi:hypothetical protein
MTYYGFKRGDQKSDRESLREAVSRRVRGLLSKTTDNGATEAEAIASAAKAREIMDRYRLTMSDVEIQEEEIVKEEVDRENPLRFAPTDYCASGIERYCGIKIWYQKRCGVRRAIFFGLKSDVKMARYLYEMIAGTIKVQSAAYARSASCRDRDDPRGFRLGMAARIDERLSEMARAAEPVATTASGTALVVVKNAIVDAAYSDLHLKLRKSRLGGSLVSHRGYAAGKEAGNRVNLGRPVGGYKQGLLS